MIAFPHPFSPRKRGGKTYSTLVYALKIHISGSKYLLPAGPVLVEARNDESESVVFFASPEDIWNFDFMAMNTATGETISIAGMNRFADVFVGGGRPSLLMLTEGDDAIFADDIATVSPEGHGDLCRRLSGLQEILGGGGQDVIDLTCMNFSDIGEDIALRGGPGDDVIWGGCGDTMLFGDEGNDRLTGNAGGGCCAAGQEMTSCAVSAAATSMPSVSAGERIL